MNQDSQEDIIKYQKEITKLTADLNENRKTISALQHKISFQNEVAQSTAETSIMEDVANYQLKISELSDRLKKEEKRMDKLETENFDLNKGPLPLRLLD